MEERRSKNTKLPEASFEELDVEEDSVLVVFCSTCAKVLYETPVDNSVTRNVASSAELGHRGAFRAPHNVSTVPITRKIS